MKKLLTICASIILLTTSTYASAGEIGYFGGITSGVKLPTWTSLAQDNTKKTSKYSLPYKEMVYLSGRAEEVEGTIEIKPGDGIDKEKAAGDYTETYKVTAQNADNTVRVSRNITFTTEYIYEAERKQATKVSKVSKWSEIITVDGKSYQLDDDLSYYSKSILEEYTPGVTYYRGDIQYDAVYKPVGDEGENVVMSVNGPVYGYEQAFAKTETQRRSITIDLGNGDGYAIEETPTFTVHRDIAYGANEPTAISMAGNYKEIIRSEGTLSYNILQGSAGLYEDERSGMISLQNTPTIEQLSIPTNLNLQGHPAETDIKKMYSMKIFTDNAAYFSTNKVVTKGEYIKMLVTALNIDLPEEKTSKRYSKKEVVEVSPFVDIKSGDTYYKYAKAAYDAGLIGGGVFDANKYLTRELMYVLNIRAIGLERLGIGTMGTYTPFVDDQQISSWAKTSLYAASKIGIISESNGYIFPKKYVTKAECATLLEQYINYLRYDLQKDYNDKMLLG